MRLFLDRLRTAWNTVRDNEHAQLLLTGPLPLWMQDVFEKEATRIGVPVGDVIFQALRNEAKYLLAEAT